MTNIEKLGMLLNGRMCDLSQAGSPLFLELGTIKGTSLLADSFQDVIPAGSYMINAGIRKITSGDRVLVAWCGAEPIVVCRLKSS